MQYSTLGLHPTLWTKFVFNFSCIPEPVSGVAHFVFFNSVDSCMPVPEYHMGSDWFTRLTGRPAQLSGIDSSPCISPPIIFVHLFSWEIQLSETLFICFWTFRRHGKWKSGPLASPYRSGRVELAQELSGLRYLPLSLMPWVQSQDLRSWRREPLPKVVLWSLYTCHATHTHTQKCETV